MEAGGSRPTAWPSPLHSLRNVESMTIISEATQRSGSDAGESRAADGERPPRAAGLVFPPAMEERFRPVLAALYDEMHARPDVIALLCFGSAQRGESRPGSDLDLCAVTDGDTHWLHCRMVQGVEVQTKVGPVRAWRRMMDRQNPAILGAFATGVLLFDKTGAATELKRFAEERFQAGPRVPSATDVEGGRYSLTNKVRDLEDMSDDSVAARMLSGMTVVEAIRIWGVFQSLWMSRKPTVMLHNLRTRDPRLAETIEAFYGSPSIANAIAVADEVLERMGGRLYEITTPPERA